MHRVSNGYAGENRRTHECRNADRYSDHVNIRQTPRLIDQCLETVFCRKIGFRDICFVGCELVVPNTLMRRGRIDRDLVHGRRLEKGLGRGEAGDDVQGVETLPF